MGWTCDRLIVPAILFDNPGVDRSTLVNLLDSTHCSPLREYKDSDPLDSYDKEHEDKDYHNGLKGLASFLGLRESKKFEDF